MAKKPEPRLAVMHDAGLARCGWPGVDPIYVAYHDNEWGVPEYDSRALFEKLLLDGFQAGLSWITSLRKRDKFRKAFDGVEPTKIARYSAAKLDKLMTNEGIIRNRQKIDGSVLSARAYLAIAAGASAQAQAVDDPHAWLEDVSGDKSLDWVKARNAKAEA